ncbi:MAG: right-handed parallel beta-helix repeat-containing protein [Candidatus Lokiarchaeota archaeon]|nr:right-handed parallel beta-helix repeat-containing protein [Candidatus Lokiarchaeota archaeon]
MASPLCSVPTVVHDASEGPMFTTGTPRASAPMAEYYVATNGSDSNPGNETHPFLTVGRAQQAVRANTSSMIGDIVVYLRGGTYRIPNTLAFTPEDGGSGLYNVTYKAYSDEVPVIDGGDIIPHASWIVHDGSIWRAYVGGGSFRQLYVRTAAGANHNTPTPSDPATPEYPYAGVPASLSVMTPAYDGSGHWERRAIRARGVPPEGTFKLTAEGHEYMVKEGFWSDLREWKLPFTGILPGQPQKLGAAQHYAQDIEMTYQLMWNMPRIHVYFVGEHQGVNKVLMQQPAFSIARTKGGAELGRDYEGTSHPNWVENAYALLDEPGEWYHDRHTGWLFYKPLGNEPSPNSSSIQFIIPRVEKLVQITGNATDPVSNLRFEGISFKHSSWLFPNTYGVGHVDSQANVLVWQDANGRHSQRSDAAVNVTYGDRVQFERCVFSKLGTAALALDIGTQNSTVRGCTFDDISGTGVNIGTTNKYYPNWTVIADDDPQVARNNSVTRCYITNVCVEYKGGHGVWAGYVQGTRIEHNEISGTAYTAISCGWGWSYDRTYCFNNSISHNHITNYMMEMKDGAAIYTLGLQNGTHVEHNHIHDGGGSGLYPDEQTAQTYWRYNVVYRSGNSLQDHTLGPDRDDPIAIRENVIVDNFFDMDPIIEPRRQEPHLPNNVWRIGVGNDVDAVPNAVVMANVAGAGLDPAYQDLLVGTEQIRKKDASGLYWSDMYGTEELPLGPEVFWAGIVGIAALGVSGGALILKQKGRRPFTGGGSPGRGGEA